MTDLTVLFSSHDFIPHGHCYLWRPALVWLHVLSDTFTALAYYSIPVFLIALALKRQDLPFRPLFWLFGGFIISCGTTHWIDVVTLWYPVYWLSGTIKAITTLLSVWTALNLIPLFPQAVALPSIEQYELANQTLQQEIAERKQIETALQESQALNARLAAAALKEKDDVLGLFAQYAPAGIAMFDREMRYIIASQRWIDDYHLETLDTLIGRSHYELFPDLPERWRQIHQRCLAGAIEKCDEDLFVRTDGWQQWTRWEVRPWYTATGEIGGIIIFAEDITQRKRSKTAILQLNQELQKKVTELQTLLEVIPIGIGIAEDPECQHIRVNPAFAEVLGIPPTVNASLSASQEDRPTNFKVYQNGREMLPEELPLQYAATHGVEIRDLEVDVVWQDGTTITLLEYATPLLDASGQPRGSVGAFLNITDRKRAEAELRERERLFSTLAEALPVAFFRFDASSHCTYINNYWTKMTGRTVESVMGLGWLETLHPDDADRLASAWLEWSQNAQERGLYQNEGRFVHLNGQDVWYFIQALPEVNDNGETIGYIGVLTDITNRKKTETALNHLNAELEQRVADRTAALQTLSDRLTEAQAIAHIGSWEWDVVTNTIFWSDEVFHIYGMEPGQPEPDYDSHLKQQFMPEDGQRLRQAVTKALEQSEPYELDLQIIRVDGSTGWIFAKGKSVLNEQNQVVRLVGIVLDITARKTVEIQQKRLNQLKDDFLNTVSHELRSPLINIRMVVEVLEMTFKQSISIPGTSPFTQPDRLKRYLEILREQCDQELELINNLLNLQRLEADRFQGNAAPIQVNEWISNIADAFEGRMQERQQHLQVLLPNTPLFFNSDISVLTSVLRELLTNACKYTPPEGSITVSVFTNSTHLQLRVSNSGVQIAQEELERIFDKFYRIPESDQWQQGGTGLGLALMKKQIEYLGGLIWAESDKLGVHFVVSLPIEI